MLLEKPEMNNINPRIYDHDFVSLINNLNESIKEYYKISKHNIKETDNYILNFENYWESLQNLVGEASQNKSFDKIDEIYKNIIQTQNLINQLKNNSSSNENNLNLFFKDAKIIFKKMKLKRIENITNFRNSLSTKKNDSKNNNLNVRLSNSYGKNNSNMLNLQNMKQNIIKKLIYYLNQLKDYNEIIGKFSIKAKYNFINLQKMIFSVVNEFQENSINFKNNFNSYNQNSNYQLNLNRKKNDFDNIENIDKYEIKNKYENEISNLNNKIKQFEKILNENKINYLQGQKFEELKKKIELELITANINNNINFERENDFESMILNIIDINKNSSLEIKDLKADIIKKNEIIKNLKLNNNQLKHDLLDKDNILQEKEDEILTLNQDNRRYKQKYEESNKLIKNLNNVINSQKNENFNYKNKIFEYQSNNLYDSLNNNINNNNESIMELKNKIELLSKENFELKNELNNKKYNIAETPKSMANLGIERQFFENNSNDKNIDMMKYELELQKKNLLLNKKKYETEISSLSKKIQDLSKQLTSKMQEIIILQRENIKLKSLSQSNDLSNSDKVKTFQNNNININKLLEENKKSKEKIKNYNNTIIGLKQELQDLRKFTEENNYKSLENEQQINNLQNVLNEKDELINQYKEKIQSLRNNNLDNINSKNSDNNDEINKLKMLNNNLMNEIENKNIEISNLKNVNNQSQNNIINQYKNEINKLNNAFQKTKSMLKEKDSTIKKLSNNLRMLNTNNLQNINNNSPNENLNIKITELENYINELEMKNKSLSEEIIKKKNNINNDKNNDNGNLNDINLLNLKISSLEEENEYYKNKAEELQKQLKSVEMDKNKSSNIESENSIDKEFKNKMNEQLEIVKNEKMILENDIKKLNQEISNLNLLNEKLKKENNEEKNKNIQLIQENTFVNKKNKELLENSKLGNNVGNNADNDIANKLQKKEEELEGFKTFLVKLQKDLEATKDENDQYKSKINNLQKENSSIKNQLERLSITMPKELNALQIQLDEANKKNKQIMSGNLNNNKSMTERDKSKSKPNNKSMANNQLPIEKYDNILSQLNDANKEISELKNKNKELLFQLEEKEVKSAYSGYKTEDVNLSNYEEEFDLRKMANGARDKNRSEDINIDYPGIQGIKDKLVDLEFKYKNLVEQVKILIGNITFNQKIKPQVAQICQLLGYSPKTTSRILTSPKDKKKILGI